MAAKSPKSPTTISTGRVAENRKARHEYEIVETIEAGMVLLGSEVKSLRRGRASIAESMLRKKTADWFWLMPISLNMKRLRISISLKEKDLYCCTEKKAIDCWD